MARFKDFDDDQRAALKELLLRAVDRRVKEDIEYTNHVYRLLVLGNGAGIVLLASFIGVIVGRGHAVGDRVSPLSKFLLGCVLAAFIFAPLMGVASQAVIHQFDQTVLFFRNELEFEAIQGWSLNKKGRILVGVLALLSLACFVAGVAQCIWLLNTLKT